MSRHCRQCGEALPDDCICGDEEDDVKDGSDEEEPPGGR